MKFFKNLKLYFQEYCSCTSVHGFRYFGEQRTIFEKIWWLIVFLTSLGACVFSIYTVYKKWEQSPVIVSFANRGTPIYKIPFPAVTICPEAKFVPRKFNYTLAVNKKLRGIRLTDEESNRFDYMSLICDEFHNLTSNRSTFQEEFYDIINELKPIFQIENCNTKGKPLSCESIFRPIITEEGVCYTFNMLDRSEIFRENVFHYRDYHQMRRYSTNWSIDYGYTSNAGVHTYPRRALLAGIKNGFTFDLVTHKGDLDYICKDSFQGYKVLIHPPTSIPTPSQENFRVPLDHSIAAQVHPSLIDTSDSVRSYPKERRRCYFQTERHLQYFKIYNSINCDIECMANYTLDMCDCVPFYMPRDNRTNICGSGRLECLKEAERKLQLKNLEQKIGHLQLKKKRKSQIHCDCLPVCTDLNYDVETSQTDWAWNQWYSALEQAPIKDAHLSSLIIYFKSDDFITSERNELYGPIDFLANFGGLLGLFTGFSVLSLMEIVYFMSVRILCNRRLFGQWAGESL